MNSVDWSAVLKKIALYAALVIGGALGLTSVQQCMSTDGSACQCKSK